MFLRRLNFDKTFLRLLLEKASKCEDWYGSVSGPVKTNKNLIACYETDVVCSFQCWELRARLTVRLAIVLLTRIATQFSGVWLSGWIRFEYCIRPFELRGTRWIHIIWIPWLYLCSCCSLFASQLVWGLVWLCIWHCNQKTKKKSLEQNFGAKIDIMET